jgi:hypothetical protein
MYEINEKLQLFNTWFSSFEIILSLFQFGKLKNPKPTSRCSPHASTWVTRKHSWALFWSSTPSYSSSSSTCPNLTKMFRGRTNFRVDWRRPFTRELANEGERIVSSRWIYFGRQRFCSFYIRTFIIYYNARRLIESWIIESAAYCNHKLLAHLYLNSTQNTLRLIESFGYYYHFYGGPK